MIRRPKVGMLVKSTRATQVMTVESVAGDAVWCTWHEDGQLRRGVFGNKELEKV